MHSTVSEWKCPSPAHQIIRASLLRLIRKRPQHQTVPQAEQSRRAEAIVGLNRQLGSLIARTRPKSRIGTEGRGF